MYDVFIEWEGRKPLSRFWQRVRGRAERRRKVKLSDLDAGLDPGCFDLFDVVAVIMLAIVAVIVVVVFAPILIGFLIELAALAVLLLLALAGAVYRTLFRRPWRVVALSGVGELWAWRRVGWRNAQELVSSIRDGLDAGLAPATLHAEFLEDGVPHAVGSGDLGLLANPWFRLASVSGLTAIAGLAVLLRLTS